MVNKGLRASVATFALALAFVFPSLGYAQQIDELHNKLPDSVKTSGVIRVGSPVTIAPHVFLKDDQLVGISVDLSRAMEPLLGVKFEWTDMQWPGIIPGLQGGSLDASLGIISLKPERKDILNMIPFSQGKMGFLTPAGVEGISGDPQSLCGRVVGVIQGSLFVTQIEAEAAKCVANGKPGIEVKQFASNAAVIAAFQAGNMDAWLHGTVELVTAEKNLGNGAKLYTAEGWATPPTTIATAADQRGLAEALLGALHILVDNGEYAAIFARYESDAAMDKSEMSINP